MKKITAFIGSARRKSTFQAIQEFERDLKQYGEIDFEYVFLSEYRLEFCQGCKVCFDKGEEFCPLKDDRNVLLEKLEHSDGVIFATPNYAFQVSARMKNFFDRFAYLLHRPRFFGKTFTAIVTQGIYGGNNILKYLEKMGENLGFHVTAGSCVSTLEPMNEQQQKKLKQKIRKSSEKFYKGLVRSTPPVPTFFRLMLFRMSRSSIQSLDESYFDYFYYKEKGWFESAYYYDISLRPVKEIAGCFFDLLGRKMGQHK
ncbi:flavodoxin family protein [Sinanaerobacter chloroacetimidivorans]|uniref:Flavodoxin family protein n=1 Tax=Sinanaerobacter chloroacetimidivorans TaxID=2818044 RepID=A0A8J7W5D0_9FIRM|nr:flavodoxin family protein [Sinanaerobacter chloroacetimidivorans]MBR0599341.1 flavodoxin family protein [Sinanaerobacter chloroacetimidivorans]